MKFRMYAEPITDSALLASSEDCEGAASTASVTAASTSMVCETPATLMEMVRGTVAAEATLRPVRLSLANPAAETSTA